LFLEVWREACRHPELEHSLERIAQLIANHVVADHIVVRQVDLTHGGLETVASAACRPARTSLSHARTELTGGLIREVLAWCQNTKIRTGRVPSTDPILGAIAPPRYRGHCAGAPLHFAGAPAGALLLLSAHASFSDDDCELLVRLAEPIGVALANSARVHELKRLREALEADKQTLLRKLGRHDMAEAVVGAETGLRAAMEQVEHVAATDVPVLIVGETGSGKEVLARALHERSGRARAPIVRVNCGAIPPGLVDSELFGHERGSFTGAVATRQGWFERADGGTLFLDEIGELPLDAQVRLLRILQDGTFERVGGQQSLFVDVRIVAATHRDLRDMVSRGSFREDLWYRISVFPIQLPPLRERREDIPRLAAHFAARAATRLGMVPLMPTADDLDLLLSYNWPGNVRELSAVIERAAILGGGKALRIAAALGTGVVAAVPTPSPERVPVAELSTLEAAMREHIEQALASAGGRIEGPHGAAARLQVNPHTLRARMRKLGIEWDRFRGGDATLPSVADAKLTLDAAMAAHIRKVLEETSGRVEGRYGAAARLRINPHTLRARMRKLGVNPAAYRSAAARQ
jgi:hydrogenase-4 transcriptional activator